uniref:Putative secreted protein n=1 Tax=Anopheles darlingi TaxID=43151 RepID=A0A2M4DE70_ANODA
MFHCLCVCFTVSFARSLALFLSFSYLPLGACSTNSTARWPTSRAESVCKLLAVTVRGRRPLSRLIRQPLPFGTTGYQRRVGV